MKITADHIRQATDADLTSTRRALDELFTFVRETLHGLIAMEIKETGSRSLEQSCRLDIGIIEDQDSSLQYFVNEVERGPHVCLWAGKHWPQLVGKVAEKLGKSIFSWIKNSR